MLFLHIGTHIKSIHMKKLLLLLCVGLFATTTYCQLKQISVSKVYTLHVKGMNCLDSVSGISTTCSLGQERLTVFFYSAYLDKTNSELQLIGRVCIAKQMNSSGVAGIDIFRAIKSGNKLINRQPVGKTTYDRESIYNDGFFDIRLKFNKKESLFFYGYRYFIEEFAIGKLLE